MAYHLKNETGLINLFWSSSLCWGTICHCNAKILVLPIFCHKIGIWITTKIGQDQYFFDSIL